MPAEREKQRRNYTSLIGLFVSCLNCPSSLIFLNPLNCFSPSQASPFILFTFIVDLLLSTDQSFENLMKGMESLLGKMNKHTWDLLESLSAPCFTFSSIPSLTGQPSLMGQLQSETAGWELKKGQCCSCSVKAVCLLAEFSLAQGRSVFVLFS